MKKLFLLFLMLPLLSVSGQSPFLAVVAAKKKAAAGGTDWQVQITTTTSPQDFKVNLTFGGSQSLLCDWGDASSDTYTTTGVKTHSYATAGVHVLKMSGSVQHVNFYSSATPTLVTGLLTPVNGVTGITSFDYTFYNCSNLTGSIPTGLFDNTTSVTSFTFTFRGCSGLTGSIPTGLFDYTPSVTSFNSTFYDCSGLTGAIPTGLFDYTTSVTSYYATFYSCSGLTGSIPTGLFDYTTSVTTFGYTFRGCSNLTGSIPTGLFDYTPSVTTFEATFFGCFSLTGPTVQNSSGQELWELTPTPTGTYCYNNDTGLSNYASIPAGWK